MRRWKKHFQKQLTEQLYSRFHERYDQIEPVIQSIAREPAMQEDDRMAYATRRLLVARLPVWVSGVAACALVAFVCLYVFNPFEKQIVPIVQEPTTSKSVSFDARPTYIPRTTPAEEADITSTTITTTTIPHTTTSKSVPTQTPNPGKPLGVIYPIYHLDDFVPPTTTPVTTTIVAPSQITTTKTTTTKMTTTQTTSTDITTTSDAGTTTYGTTQSTIRPSEQTEFTTTSLGPEVSTTTLSPTSPITSSVNSGKPTWATTITTKKAMTSASKTTIKTTGTAVPTEEGPGNISFVKTSLEAACQALGIPLRSSVPVLQGTTVQVYLGYYQGYPLVLRVEYTDTATKTVTGLIELSKIPYTVPGNPAKYTQYANGRMFRYDNTGPYATYVSFSKVYPPYSSVQSMADMAEQWARA